MSESISTEVHIVRKKFVRNVKLIRKPDMLLTQYKISLILIYPEINKSKKKVQR